MKNNSIRLAGVQGFYGDNPTAAIYMAAQALCDFMIYDALAELTLSILRKDMDKDPNTGFAKDILFHAKRVYPLALANSIKIVTNGGGLAPKNAAEAVKEILDKEYGKTVKIAYITGDDVVSDLEEWQAQGIVFKHMETESEFDLSKNRVSHANVYIGAKLIKEALDAGADIVIAGRVADPCLALGVLAHVFGWDLDSTSPEDLDKMAAGILIGHLLECGGQVAGGNAYSEWKKRDYTFTQFAYPIATVNESGAAIFSIPSGVGGKISKNTVREQLVYEIHDPSRYISPDVTVDLTSVTLEEIGDNQVRVDGAKGFQKPDALKLCIGIDEGYMTDQIFFFSWPYAMEKAQSFIEAAKAIWQTLPISYERFDIQYIGLDGIHPGVAPSLDSKKLEALNEIGIRIAIHHKERSVGKMMLQSIVCLGLNGPPGIVATMQWGKVASKVYGLFPALIDRSLVQPKMAFVS